MLAAILGWLGWLASLALSPVTVGLIVLLLTLVYLYLTRNKNCWKGKGIPSMSYHFPMGNAGLEFFKKPFHQTSAELYETTKKAGGCVGMVDWVGPALSVTDPEIIKAVLVKDFETFPDRRVASFSAGIGIMGKMMTSLHGQEWKDVRNISTPTFSTGKIRSTTGILVEQANILAEQLFKESSQADGEINMKEVIARYTMDTIASVAFGLNADSIRNPESPIAKKATDLRKPMSSWKFLRFVILTNLPSFITKRYDTSKLIINNDAIEFFANISRRTIKEREEHPEQRRNDYLQLLLDSRKDDSQKRKLTDDEIIAQCILFFFAGNDTTSNALTWAARLLAFYPAVQERVQAEIDDNLHSDNDNITFDMINSNMPLLDRVLAETLRMYPLMQLTRASNRDWRIPGTDTVLPANSMVYMYPHSMQRDPDLYPNPDTFDPDRFLESPNPYAYLPFGQGPRNCIGMRFAQLQAKVALVAVLRKYSLVTGPKSGDVQPVFFPGFSQTQEKDGTWLKVVRR